MTRHPAAEPPARLASERRAVPTATVLPMERVVFGGSPLE